MAATTTTTTLVKTTQFTDLLDSNGATSFIYEHLNFYDKCVFANVCKACLSAFIAYIQELPKERQKEAKAMALREFILRPGQEDFYPMSYLHELKKIGCELSKSPEFWGQLRKALYEEDRVALRILIDFGADPSKLMGDLLHKELHIERDLLEIVLSSPKIDFNYKYYRNEYPLLLAAIFLDKIEIWHVLANYDNVDWNYKDMNQRNLAFWSACCRSKDVLNFLRVCHMKKVKMDEKDVNGHNSLYIAVTHNKPEVVQFLVEECKMDINEQDESGKTIAHECCERSLHQILEYLIPKGLKVDIANMHKETAIDYARMYHSEETIQILRKHNLWNDFK
mmetsp:Transcript_67670/g.107412  ORF Transcript_67670/g.107412 Transcript_67670/m.107412 type:complete len:337 (-) Transcript_67670:683-1693(-)